MYRCYDQRHKNYKDYGGRGIDVCETFHEVEFFCTWAQANGWEKGLTLDRINNDRGYYPDNIQFVTMRHQTRNRRSNKWFTYQRKTMILKDWAVDFHIKYRTLYDRIYKHHWSFEKAITTPVGSK
jgi:hypothetical protein